MAIVNTGFPKCPGHGSPGEAAVCPMCSAGVLPEDWGKVGGVEMPDTVQARRIDELEAKLAVAVEALEHYADRDNWFKDGEPHLTRYCPTGTEVADYCGTKLAQEALAKIQEKP